MERAPIWDTNARGAFIGLTFAHTRQHCTRAVYESIGYAIRHILEICEIAAGIRAEELVICGGGSRSDFWNQMKADILQRDVTPSMDNQTGCLGAAILASVGIGIYRDLKEACGQMIEKKGTLSADPKYKEVYETGYQMYRSCYPALKPVWTKISTVESANKHVRKGRSSHHGTGSTAVL